MLGSEPATYAAATYLEDWNLWELAVKAELDALHRNKTWEVVPTPSDRRIVDCKWVFKHKLDANGEIAKYKARVVAKGFSQVHGMDYDETFAPVAYYDSLRLLLALAAHNNWTPMQYAVKSAFLYGTLNERTYLQLPPGYRKPGTCVRLNKCLYGLKQSPREWYSRLSTFLSELGFAPTIFDPCVFV